MACLVGEVGGVGRDFLADFGFETGGEVEGDAEIGVFTDGVVDSGGELAWLEICSSPDVLNVSGLVCTGIGSELAAFDFRF